MTTRCADKARAWTQRDAAHANASSLTPASHATQLRKYNYNYNYNCTYNYDSRIRNATGHSVY